MSTPSGSFPSLVDGLRIATTTWDDVAGEPRGVVQVAHGLGEHAGRYARLAAALNDAGLLVAATDHRGHGRTGSEAPGGLGDFGAAGFEGLVADVERYGELLGTEHHGLPVFLLGHSMGSFAAQWAVVQRDDLYAGVVLSGSTSLDLFAAGMAEQAAAADPGAPSGLEAFNVGFEHRTGFEWLSRDEAEVDAYVADPWCGFAVPEETVGLLVGGADRLADPAVLGGIRPDLPLLLASGTDDPLAGGGDLVEELGRRYREAGVRDVTVRLYPGARHEILNETNRAEVTGDVVAWLVSHLPG